MFAARQPVGFDPHFASVEVLLAMDGAENGTTFIDTSRNNRSITSVGAQTRSTQRKFGATSCAILANSDKLYCTVPALGTGDFTIECWTYGNPASSYQYAHIFQVGTSNVVGQTYLVRDNLTNPIRLVAGVYTGPSTWTTVVESGPSTVLTTDTWVHTALVRSANTWKLFMDGVDTGGGSTLAVDLPGTILYIGGSTASFEGWGGYIDDFRLTRGVARYTANFTPPTRPNYNR